MDINLDRVLGRLEELYQCGAQEDGRSSWTISGSWE